MNESETQKDIGPPEERKAGQTTDVKAEETALSIPYEWFRGFFAYPYDFEAKPLKVLAAPTNPINYTEVYPDFSILIFRKEKTIPFEEEVVKDPTHSVGWKKVLQPGINGIDTYVYETEVFQGIVRRKTIIRIEHTQIPQKRIIAIGIKKAELDGGAIVCKISRHMIDYWPYYLQQVYEFQQIIRGEEPEIEYASCKVQESPNNFFVSTLNEDGIKRWEKIMGIVPDFEDTLGMRRAEIMLKYLGNLPYTYRNLKIFLSQISPKVRTELFFDDYLLKIWIALKKEKSRSKLYKDLREIVPANMIIDLIAVIFMNVYKTKLWLGVAGLRKNIYICSPPILPATKTHCGGCMTLSIISTEIKVTERT